MSSSFSDRTKLYPHVIPNGYVDWTEPGMWVSWPVSSEVHVGLAFDLTGLVRNARPEELAQMGLDEGSAFDLAADNLARSLSQQEFEMGWATLADGVEVSYATGSWMAPAGGLLIKNFYDNMAARFGVTEFVAIVPNQQTLVAFPATERTFASSALRDWIDDAYSNNRKPISRSWLSLTGGWPGAYAGPRAPWAVHQ